MDYVRCPLCGQRLPVRNEYGSDKDRRDWDPDWVLERHISREH